MSSRPYLKQYNVMVNGDMSSTITSAVTIIDNISMISYDISWVGTGCLGVITIEVSNTYKQNPAGDTIVAGNWTPITLSTTTSVLSNTGNGFIDIDKLAAYAVRLKYTPSAGTGVMNVVVTGKVA